MTKLEKESAELKKQLEMAEQVASSNPALFVQNCNLKAENAGLKNEIDELKDQNKTILEDNDTLNKWVDELKELHESDKKAMALLMQKWEAERNELKAHCKAVDEVNEKMKCCQNCNHNGKPEDFEHCRNCDRPCASPNDEIIKDEWELAE